MIFKRENVPVVETNRTDDRDYEAEFEDKEIGIFYQPNIRMAYMIDLDYNDLWAFDTVFNKNTCIGIEGLTNKRKVSELNETLFKEIEEFYGGINLYDFDVKILEEVRIDMPI